LVRRAFQLSSGTKVITKPLAILQHLDDSEWLAQIEAVDRFTANMIAYPGRTFGQLYHRMVKHNQLRTGKVALSGHEIDLASITVPVLVFAGNTDGIAPIASVKAVLPMLPNAAEVRFEIVPGGHLGMLTGRAARRTTWVVMDEWIAQHSTPDPGEEPPVASVVRRRPARKTAKTTPKTTKAPAKVARKTTRTAAKRTTESQAKSRTTTPPRTKATSTSSTTEKTRPASGPAPTDVAPDRGAIGSNPERRFTSGASRGLAPKR
jgi:polyhydroxyalkanoate synthase